MDLSPGSRTAPLTARAGEICSRIHALCRAHGRSDHRFFIAARRHLENVVLQRAHLNHLVEVLTQEVEVEMLGVESGDEEFPRARQVDGIRGGRGQCAMPELHEFHATLVAFPRVLKYLIGLHVQKAEAHRAVPHDALQMPNPSAAAIAFARIQRDHYVAAFPDPWTGRINSKADAVAQSPHPD